MRRIFISRGKRGFILTQFHSFHLFLFDLDGTLYLGNQLFGFTKELLAVLRSQNKRVLFMTNNSSKSVADYVRKLNTLGVAASEEDFITSSQVTAQYLKQHYGDRKIYVAGTESFFNELGATGLDVTTERSGDVGCVVSGFDTELTFRKLQDVCRLLLRDIPYIATNPDLVCPTEFGYVPDCGSVSQMLFNATGKKPLFIGKPAGFMPEYAIEKWHAGKSETLIIGDRLYTDIACGIRAGIPSLLVLSGETTREMLQKSEYHPDYVLADCGELLKALKSEP